MSDPPPPPPRPELPYQPAPGPDQPPRGRTDGFAVASFVLGLLGVVLLSVIFGILALRRIRERGLGGRGLAIAGLALSGVWTLVIAGVVAAAILTDGVERDDSGRITSRGAVSVFDLQPGDCLAGVEQTEAAVSLDATPCEDPHGAEVIGAFDLAGGDWPGTRSVTAIAEERCAKMLADTPGGDAPDAEPFYFHPTEESWAADDREVVCVALFDRPRRGALDGG